MPFPLFGEETAPLSAAAIASRETGRQNGPRVWAGSVRWGSSWGSPRESLSIGPGLRY